MNSVGQNSPHRTQNEYFWVLLAVGSAVAATAGIYQQFCNNGSCEEEKHQNKKSSSVKNKRNKRLPPRNPEGILSTLAKLANPTQQEFILEQSEELGELVYRVLLPIPPSCAMYIVGHPTLIRDILTDPLTDKARPLYDGVDSATCGLPTMFTSPNNQHWKCVRKGTAPAFSATEINRMKSVCQHELDRWIRETLDPIAQSGGTVDPYEEMNKVTFRTICVSAFEYPHITDEEIKSFGRNFEMCMNEFDRRTRKNPFRILLTPFLKDRQRAFEASHQLEALAQRILDHYRALDDNEKSPNKTVIRLLVENKHLTIDKMITAEILIFLLAGHDTTGFTLASAFYHLAKYPKVHDRLVESVREFSSGSNGESKKHFCVWKGSLGTFSAGKNDNYFHWFLRENSRILPVAIGSGRKTGREFIIPAPPRPRETSHSIVKNDKEADETVMVIPKGSLVLAPQYLTNRSSLVFERPLEFDPLRWENATPEMIQAVIPFSLGNRGCIGQALAQTEIATILTSPQLLEQYTWEIISEGRIECALTLSMVDTKLRPIRRK